MQEFLKTINKKFQETLDFFFDEPISITFSILKSDSKRKKLETKDGESPDMDILENGEDLDVSEAINLTKVKFGLKIEFRGHEYPSIKYLSGGELQRCNLALSKAMCEIFGSKFILIDEAINNLSEHSNLDILMKMKEWSHAIPLVVISHEANSGVFEKIIELQT